MVHFKNKKDPRKQLSQVQNQINFKKFKAFRVQVYKIWVFSCRFVIYLLPLSFRTRFSGYLTLPPRWWSWRYASEGKAELRTRRRETKKIKRCCSKWGGKGLVPPSSRCPPPNSFPLALGPPSHTLSGWSFHTTDFFSFISFRFISVIFSRLILWFRKSFKLFDNFLILFHGIRDRFAGFIQGLFKIF